ncbi:hypothetical protein IQ07DRAFT_583780 [Pyrenochaeta sp. DS3sAY3a]|nr:hypothetical protein IQ07DRAFT_583780 [Pyrenochaeta sp. DS3sAY3a]
MSSSEARSPMFLRLPRELRDQIYEHVFETASAEWLPHQRNFPTSWTRDYGHDSTRFFHTFPALCCVSHQLFQESVPIFLTRVETFTFNIETCQRLLDWLAQFPDDEAFRAIRDYSSFEWNAFDSTSINLHTSLLSRMSNLASLALIFTFPDLAHSWKLVDHNWGEELTLFTNFGVPYPFTLYYTPDFESPAPEDRRFDHEIFKNERTLLQQKLEEFIKVHRLEVILNLAKLAILELQFDVKDEGCVRHNLCRPLNIWFKKMWEERGRSVQVMYGSDENP